MNHGYGQGPGGATVRWKYNVAAEAADFRTIRSVRQGGEFLINYTPSDSGRHPMQQEHPFYFLLNYGFLEGSATSVARTQAADTQTSNTSSAQENAEQRDLDEAALLIQSRLRGKKVRGSASEIKQPS